MTSKICEALAVNTRLEEKRLSLFIEPLTLTNNSSINQLDKYNLSVEVW